VSERPAAARQGLGSAFVDEQLVRCNRCGLCLAACPTYRLSGVETDSARGRIALLEAIRSGQLPLDASSAQPFFQCILCGACTETCMTSVDTNELVILARAQYYRKRVPPTDQQFAFNHLLPRTRRLTVLMRVLSSAKRSGLAEIARRLGLVRLISPTLHTALGWVDTIPPYSLRDRLRRLGFRRQRHPAGKFWLRPARVDLLTPGAQVLYFVGCASNFGQPDAAEAAIRVLARAGCDVMVVHNFCCGFPAYAAGQHEAARHLAALNVLALSRYPFEVIVSECPECSYFLKRYGELLDGDEEAVRISGAVRDFTEFATELKLPQGNTAGRLAYHDPCYLRRGQGITDQPRALLTGTAGAELVELADAGWCCGAGAFQSLTQPDLSQAVLQRKLAAIEQARVDTVVTACPLCITQLSQGLRRAGSSTAVKHVAQVLAESLGPG
jgi:glycolate oxidase iron-sulfur subunit